MPVQCQAASKQTLRLFPLFASYTRASWSTREAAPVAVQTSHGRDDVTSQCSNKNIAGQQLLAPLLWTQMSEPISLGQRRKLSALTQSWLEVGKGCNLGYWMRHSDYQSVLLMGGSSICSKLIKSHHLPVEFVWLPQTPGVVPSLAFTWRWCLSFGETVSGWNQVF